MNVKMFVRRTTTAILIIALAFGASATAFAAPNAKANGTVEPYELSLTALKGKDKTDLYISVKPKVENFTAPELLKKVQLKSFSTDGEHEYTNNLFDLVSPSGVTSIELNDVDRYQVMETKVAVKNAQTVSEKNLNGSVTVLLRPDLSIDEVTAPEQAKVNVPFTVSANLKETNLDVGASAKVTIFNGSEVLDVAEGIVVEKGGSKSIAFALQLPEAGDYNLSVVISDVTPADYDEANNTASFSVQVVNNIEPVSYSSNYSYTSDYESNYEEYDYYGRMIQENQSTHSSESFSLNASTPDVFDPQGDFELNLTDEDGNTQAITISNLQYQDWGYYYGYKAYYAHDPETNITVVVYKYDWGTHIYASKYAGDYQYSNNYNGWFDSGGSSQGEILGAKQNLSVDFKLPTTTGSSYGGSYDIPLTYSPYTWDYSNYYNWYYNSYRSWGHSNQYSGYSNGITQVN